MESRSFKCFLHITSLSYVRVRVNYFVWVSFSLVFSFALLDSTQSPWSTRISAPVLHFSHGAWFFQSTYKFFTSILTHRQPMTDSRCGMKEHRVCTNPSDSKERTRTASENIYSWQTCSQVEVQYNNNQHKILRPCDGELHTTPRHHQLLPVDARKRNKRNV